MPPGAAGERLDRFLAGLDEVGSRAAAERLLGERRVLVDGAVRAKSYRLEGGEQVELLRFESRGPHLGNVELELLAPLEAVALRAHGAVDEDSLLPEQALRGGAGADLFEPCQKPV